MGEVCADPAARIDRNLEANGLGPVCFKGSLAPIGIFVLKLNPALCFMPFFPPSTVEGVELAWATLLCCSGARC